MAETNYTLSDAHRPDLAPGRYEIEVSWKVDISGDKGELETSEKTEFRVASERFRLTPSDIDSVYPPEGSTGNYRDDLPQIVLTRDTLPWERRAKTGEEAPWLALLLLTEEEAIRFPIQMKTLKAYRDALAAGSPKVSVGLETGEENESVTVIELTADFPGRVLPKFKELSLLCHSRTVEKDGKTVNSASVVVSKRLPSSGRNTAHLVMLEHRFTGDDFPLPTGANKCMLISLKSWSFTSSGAVLSASDGESMDAPFRHLTAGWLHLNAPDASNYEKAGFVPLHHRFRTGETGASWYAGPLSCGVPIFENAREFVNLPAECADDLLWYDEELGMLNVTYAAAWELGRLLAMQNRGIFSLLHKWRRQQIHCHQTMQAGADGACCHVPQIQCACAGPAPEAPAELKQKLDELRRLEGIPYRYLLPDERLLPPESVRFVVLDQNYIDALLDGVLSSVRAPSVCPAECRQGELKLLAGDHPKTVTGLLIRSVTVAGFPGLVADAMGQDSPEALEDYRTVQLSPSIRLFLFHGKMRRVTLRRRTDTIHLSVKRQSKLTWTNQENRALEIPESTSSAFAKRFIDQPEEMNIQVNW